MKLHLLFTLLAVLAALFFLYSGVQLAKEKIALEGQVKALRKDNLELLLNAEMNKVLRESETNRANKLEVDNFRMEYELSTRPPARGGIRILTAVLPGHRARLDAVAESLPRSKFLLAEIRESLKSSAPDSGFDARLRVSLELLERFAKDYEKEAACLRGVEIDDCAASPAVKEDLR